ncbi:uncharacterized protein AB675_4173 [Cyphellophora attinorum]|uniref:UspA domain-containing protein n=1 Tax=Cyphellophora attinorum TaxID=1664694 RepID=A0A0N0NKX4_9EURO|nr:uncharacterized protein AB675_4173 [Phialophora attinorum]KPI38651.1 hypothetical protein AB675_4173 [Phialophora attinorum]
MSNASASGLLTSLADTIDEENRETIAALPKDRASSPARRYNSGQPFPLRKINTGMPTPRHGSIAGIGVGVTSPRQKKEAPSRLDPSDPSTWTRSHGSKPNSPVLSRATPASTRPRGDSDADETQGYVGVPRADTTHRAMSDSGPARPRDAPRSGALAAALSGEIDKMNISRKEEQEKKNLQKAAGHSRSPSGRVVEAPSPDSPAHLHPKHDHHPSGSFSTVTSSDGERARLGDARDEDAVDDSSDEHHSTDSEDDARGRHRDPKHKQTEKDKSSPTSHPEPPTSPEPSISITSPDGESSEAKAPVTPLNETPPQVTLPNPTSAQDLRRGSVSTIGSVDGDDDDIAKAKTLGVSISPLDDKVADRHVRMVLRGDWTRFHKEAEAGERSVRTYLACTDLSVEATYALEWTVGTILRDGDTLLCVYSIVDESAGGSGHSTGSVSEAEKEKLLGEGAQAGKDAMNAMEGLTRQTTNGENRPMSKFIPATEAKSASGSVDGRRVGKKEMERLKAIDDITQTFLRLVRKTSLQVRCMIEVIHCKSPKHLVLGAIDELEPTLAIVGTRGRSSIKGVLLGSFSNYLVTKSSVPVMVARRKLKKPRSSVKVSSNKIRLSNNLTASSIPGKRRSLTQARID